MNACVLLLALIVGTWNGNWFPSGRAEHRDTPENEAKTIAAAAEMLRKGLEELDPERKEEVVLCLNEMRGPRVVSNLVAQIGWPKLRPAIVTGYRRRDRFDQQQDAIVTTLPVASAHWSVYRHGKKGEVTPPRGYAYIAIAVSDLANPSNFPGLSELRVYCTHLKSEYGATTEELKRQNRLKRARAVEQILETEKPPRKKGAPRSAVVLAGDINADFSQATFRADTLFATLEQAGFANPLAELAPGDRNTHPSKRYGPSTLDYIFCRELPKPERIYIAPRCSASDHRALFYQFNL